MIKRHEGAIGIQLIRWKKYLVELWLCPPSFKVAPHNHPHQLLKIIYLFGEAMFYRDADRFMAYRGCGKRVFTIAPAHSHWLEVFRKGWLGFITFAEYNGMSPTSTIEDIEWT